MVIPFLFLYLSEVCLTSLLIGFSLNKDMKTGRCYKIQEIAKDQVGMRLRSLGILPNLIICIERRAPLFGGYYVRIANKYLGLSKSDFRSLSLTLA